MNDWRDRFAETTFRRSADAAHDLKTPLNIAVLNLELLRIRMKKLAGEPEDEKLAQYAAAIDLELRRLARIFDAYFGAIVPPEEDLQRIDLGPIIRDQAERYAIGGAPEGDFTALGHPARISDLIRLFFEGAARNLVGGVLNASPDKGRVVLSVSGKAASDELGKVFKFYYTEGSGSPDLSLATARVIAETYGGTLSLTEAGEGATLRLELRQGNQ